MHGCGVRSTQRTVLARIQPQFIFHTLIFFSYLYTAPRFFLDVRCVRHSAGYFICHWSFGACGAELYYSVPSRQQPVLRPVVSGLAGRDARCVYLPAPWVQGGWLYGVNGAGGAHALRAAPPAGSPVCGDVLHKEGPALARGGCLF